MTERKPYRKFRTNFVVAYIPANSTGKTWDEIARFGGLLDARDYRDVLRARHSAMLVQIFADDTNRAID